LLFAADTVVAGVHADFTLTGLDDFGWKALAAAVSDLAAMGGEAGHAVVSVAGPGRGEVDLDRLYQGIGAAAAFHGCPVVGGDLVGAAVLVVTVAVIGSCPGRPVRRSGARPGDTVWLSGPVGAAAAGLRCYRQGGPASEQAALKRAHARPNADLAGGRCARLAGATAMIDVSDGLTADLGHLADASSVGIDLDTVPIAPGATLAEGLGGGEDYVLAFTASDPARVRSQFLAAGLSPPLPVGICSAEAGALTFQGGPLERSGWQHPW
jgi:thiamine-monophosphate kinase